MPLTLSGKVYYSSPNIVFADGGDFSNRPLAGFVIDGRGNQAAVWADSNSQASIYFIAVSDRVGPDQPRDTMLHTDLLKSGTANFLGTTFASAVAAAREAYGSAIADAMVDIIVSGD